MTGVPLSKDEPYFVPSDKLRELRELLRIWPGIEQGIGKVVQFRLVADTSIVLADIRWLAMNKKDESIRTGLLEIISAGTVKIYAPSKLLEEIENHLPNIAIRDDIELEVLQNEWRAYQLKVNIIDPHMESIERHLSSIDPNDAAFVALAEDLQAEGILSKDKHIKQMGGKQLTLDFILAVRDYSRASAIELNIICMGMSLGTVSTVTVIAIGNMIKGFWSGIVKSPDWLKAFLLFGAIVTILHPIARLKVSVVLNKTLTGLKTVTPEILDRFNKASAIAQQQGELAMQHYEKAISEIEKQ